MSERSRFIKVRVSDAEYLELRRRADEHGLTMSEHVRDAVTAVHQAVDVVCAFGTVLTLLQELADRQPPRADGVGDAQSLETVLLLRELAAARDAQILSRVRAQLASRADQAKRAGGVA